MFGAEVEVADVSVPSFAYLSDDLVIPFRTALFSYQALLLKASFEEDVQNSD